MPRQSQAKPLAELIELLDDGTTLADILTGFGWYKKEKARITAKNKKLSAIKKEQKKSPVQLEEKPV